MRKLRPSVTTSKRQGWDLNPWFCRKARALSRGEACGTSHLLPPPPFCPARSGCSRSPGWALPLPRAFSHAPLLGLVLSFPSLSLMGLSVYGAHIPPSRKSPSLHSETSSYQPFLVDIRLLAYPAFFLLSGDRAPFSLGTPRPQPTSQALSPASPSPATAGFGDCFGSEHVAHGGPLSPPRTLAEARRCPPSSGVTEVVGRQPEADDPPL